MSSLRLAMKKSLEEAGGASANEGEGNKKRRIKIKRMRRISKDGAPLSATHGGDRPPNAKRKRGRPRKHPRPEDRLSEQGELVGGAGEGTEGEHGGLKHDRSYGDDEEGSSSENEFSYDEEDEENDDSDDDDSDGEEGEVDEREDGHIDDEGGEEHGDDEDEEMRSVDVKGAAKNFFAHACHSPSLSHEHASDSHVAASGSGPLASGGKTAENDELRKQQLLLQLKAARSDEERAAAKKILKQWKKKKGVTSGRSSVSPSISNATKQSTESGEAVRAQEQSEEDDMKEKEDLSKDQPEPQSSRSSKGEGKEEEENPVVKKKKKNKAGVVPPPTAGVLKRASEVNEKECRKHIVVGLRVKVRFATKVKKEGKVTQKKIWYGGRVSVVSKKGTKIKIKYDDSTSEIAKFPDDDIVVDAVGNGEHSKPADFFLPLADDEMKMELPEDGEVEESVGPNPSPPAVREREPPTEGGAVVETQADPQVAKSPAQQEVEKESTSIPATVVDEPSKNQGMNIEAIKETFEPKTPTQAAASTAPKEAKGVDDTRSCILLASSEEGELSPGKMTVLRPEVNLPETEAMPPTVEEGAAMSTKTSDGDTTVPLEDVVMQKADETVIGGSPKPHLDVLSSEEPAKNSETPTQSKKEEASIDNVLVDTPVLEDRPKRKREDSESVEEEPPSTKLKIAEDAADEEPMQAELKTIENETVEVHETGELDVLDEKKPKSIKIRLSQIPAETTEVDLAPPHQIVGKKKKKKSERSNSPRPRSPIPKRAASPTRMTDAESRETAASLEERSVPSAKLESLPAKQAEGNGVVESKEPSLNSAMSLDAFEMSSRVGRKAAQQAKEKLTVKEKEREALAIEGKKKKKKRRIDEVEGEGDSAEDLSKGPEWVQCDSCGKWRVLPDDVKVSSLPNLWYCSMNIYDSKRSSCEAAEQTPKQALKERRKALKKAKRMEVDLKQPEVKKEKLIQLETPVASPKPMKAVKSGKSKDQIESKKKGPVLTQEEQRPPSDSGSETQKEEKKKGKKSKTKEAAEEITEAPVEPKKPGRKRGRPARNQPPSTPQPSSGDQDEDNVEWVQCEKCEKWRKLPPDISADELPDIWYCSMNSWNPTSASCTAAEDKTDSHHHEVGSSEWQLRQTHAGKYSYRQMIFGTGARKQNRPLSERSRAAESLFVKPVSDEEENPIPTTQYSKSSAFLPRTSNFNKNANVLNDESLGIFDVLSHSNLWAQLRALEQARPMKVESNPSEILMFPKFVTYENLHDEIKTELQEAVLQILANSALSGDEVVHEAQRYPWENKGMVTCCNTDVVINTLLALVRDGIVEMATSRNLNIPMAQWIPKYRRVRSKRALAAEEAIKSSKCMKIAKPWKQREETKTQWISGEEAFH